MEQEDIKKLLQAGLAADTEIHIEGSSNAFQLRLIGAEFKGLSPVRRHQKVYDLLAEPIRSGDIHAVNIQALTPEEQQD